jgi:hypothetical protein
MTNINVSVPLQFAAELDNACFVLMIHPGAGPHDFSFTHFDVGVAKPLPKPVVADLLRQFVAYVATGSLPQMSPQAEGMATPGAAVAAAAPGVVSKP